LHALDGTVSKKGKKSGKKLNVKIFRQMGKRKDVIDTKEKRTKIEERKKTGSTG
jgi:hypothetical protein